MMEIDYLYRDRLHIPVPQYRAGQRVFVLESWFGGCKRVKEKLIKIVNPPRWREGFGTMPGHWDVSYRYQDMSLGRPEGRMHSQYTLREEEIFPTEEAATIAMAQDFVESTKNAAREIAREFKRLGIPLGDNIKQLNK